MNTYDYIYGATFNHYEKLWNSGGSFTSFVTSLSLSLIIVLHLLSFMMLIHFAFDVKLWFLFSNPLVAFCVIGGIVLWHYWTFERNERYKLVLSNYENYRKEQGIEREPWYIYLYIYGSAILLMIMSYVLSRSF